MEQKRAYRSRCYPTPSQRQMLARTFGRARFVYNWGLTLRSEANPRARGTRLLQRHQRCPDVSTNSSQTMAG
jgi:hypothetical protein